MTTQGNETATLSGVVHASGGGTYEVVLDDGRRVEASLRGRIKRQARAGSRVVIGDRVVVSSQADAWTIEEVAEREAELVRRGRAGRAPKILAANLDRVFVVVALEGPPATYALIDRLLVLVESSGMRPTLVLNKADLDGTSSAGADFAALYRGIGYGVHTTSAETGLGLAELEAEMCEGSSALIGPSGVGKSSLLNAIDPSLELQTGGLSRKTGTGRHTTVGSRMITMECGGLVADTPGFGDVGLWAVLPTEVGACFPEFEEPAAECRFRECTHLHEPECGVRAGMERGEIAESRYRSYETLRGEADDAPY